MGVGRGVWVWVNVAGKKSVAKTIKQSNRKKEMNRKSCKIFMKRKSPTR